MVGPWESVADGADHVSRKILESVRVKRQKFHSPRFDKFDQNWLLLTDYRNPFSDHITDAILAQRLPAASQHPDAIGTEFDGIYIFYGPRCFRFYKGKLATKLSNKP